MPNRYKLSHYAKRAGLLISILIIVILAMSLLVGYTYNSISNHNAGQQVNRLYSSTKIPSSLSLEQKKYIGTPFWSILVGPPASTVDTYIYTYKPISSQTIRQVHDDLSLALTSSGYSLVKPLDPDPNNNLTWLLASSKQLCLSVLISSNSNKPNSPNAEVSNARIYASKPPCY